MTAEPKAYRKILLILLGRLGDYIITTPFLEGLRKAYPGAEITLITSAKAANLATGNPDLDKVVVFKGWHHPPSTLKMFAAAWRRCDLAIDLNPAYSRASLSLMRLARAPERIAFEKKAPAGVYTLTLPHDLEKDHFMDKYAVLAGRLGFTPPESMRVTLPQDLLAEGERLVRGLGFPAGDLVVAVHPGNFKKYENRWPEDKFVEFTKELLKRKGVSVFYLVGLGEEKETQDGILRHLPGVKHIPPKSAELTAAILKCCSILVCNSTGTLHLAAAAGVPTFSFNRPYNEKCWKPKGSIHAAIVSKGHKTCRDIEVADAVKAFDRAVEGLKKN
ncbi:MAG: glycosyltransferase family 9 protein [Elusimicrobiales bacterium]|nr:glycosyltransferase family 9 protein [Elusimicrobiales bacterium]